MNPASPTDRRTWRSPHGRALPEIGGRTLVMGILNVTPDSFSDGGQLESIAAVVAQARELRAQGADVLDLGGESTRPGGAPVSEDEERARVLPAIRAVRAALPEVAISIDTYKAAVAEAAIAAGADMINDVWGALHGWSAAERAEARTTRRRDGVAPHGSAMADAAARLGCPLILMHNRPDRAYQDFWDDVLDDIRLSLAVAEAAGVAREQCWIDPGFGFAKSAAQNLAVVRDLGRFVALGAPVLLGTSRKSTIGRVLGTEVDDRVEGTAATVAWGIQQGCAMVRVHDVAAMARVARMADAIKAGLEAKY